MQIGYALRDIASPHLRAPVQETTDEALIELIAEGDKRAMQVLYARHNVRVFRFIVRLTGNQSLAEDLVSEVFLDVWRQAEGFESKSQVSTWLLAIARYKALSALRRRTDEHLDDNMAATIEDTSDDPWSTPRIATPSCRSA
jgi:RNA polymerase sigma-70 factor, ECF subfamily